MYTTTITNIVKNGKREFTWAPYKAVFVNNTSIGSILSAEMTEVMEKSGIFDQIREELWEMHDPDTKSLIENYNKWIASDSISFDDFVKKYGI